MFKGILFFSFVVFCCLPVSTAFPQIGKLTILAFGDSITQGLARKYDGEGGKITWGILEPPLGRTTKDWGYPIELDKLIEANLHSDIGRSEKISASVYNWGHEGWPSSAALECETRPQNCIDTVLASQPANFILILFGSNDLYQGISAATTKFNLEQMIDKSINAGVEPIIGTITPNTDKHAPFSQTNIEDFYNPEIRDLAEEKEILLADHYTTMLEYWDALWTSGDGLHLGREGNEKMADTWYQALVQSNNFRDDVPIASILILLLKN